MDENELRLLERTAQYAVEYQNGIDNMPVFPTAESLLGLEQLEEPLPQTGMDAEAVMELLHRVGSKGTTAQTGGRYFGFVNGGLLPVAHGAQWLADTWNQNSALYVMSPVVSKLEDICHGWLVDLLGLEKNTAMGLVTGSANALICALAAARNTLLQRQGYDVATKGLRNAPPLRVVLGADAHSTVLSALSLLGIGSDEMEVVAVDDFGRMKADCVPTLDSHTLLILQAGHVIGGSYDPIEELCHRANAAGAWVHIDGAFGLWAAASRTHRHLVAGLEKADSCSMDAHKTLNAGYDCGIVFCRHREAFIQALQAKGSYIPYSAHRDGMLYTTEMSRRARAVSLWAVLKQLGAEGVEQLIDRLCEGARYFASELEKVGCTIVNPVFFNQFLLQWGTVQQTHALLQEIQNSGVCWCGGGEWKGEPVIRISVCSHATTHGDIDKSVAVFRKALQK